MTADHPDYPTLPALVAATLYLMTKQAERGCPVQAELVIRHLQFIETHPDAHAAPMLRDVCRRLIARWYDLLYRMQKGESPREQKRSIH
ncbi:MAG: hypothetical protein KatS3mg123_2381 [Burkholderiales bacterium]|nr:MAG: hypothetical protein KatS3mg123_2381 [Burkholderiales bacterium]